MPKIEQVGGNHYDAPDDKAHWDLMEKHDIAYLEATASKYVWRWPKKGKPAEDLEKAVSYLDKLLTGRNSCRRLVPWNDLQEFMDINDIRGRRTRKALILILINGDQDSLRQARNMLTSMASNVKAGMAIELVDVA